MLLGTDQPTKYDIISVRAQETPSRHDKIRAAIYAVVGRTPPALADGSGDGCPPDDTEASH
jgi:hypothetical protein